MQPLVGLPKTARLEYLTHPDLVIVNHEVQNKEGLLDWLLNVITWEARDKILPQLISQGFKFSAFLETCDVELKDSNMKYEIFSYYSGLYDSTYIETKKELAENRQGKIIAHLIMKKIKGCSDWNQFYDTIKYDDTFSEDIRQKIEKEIDNIEKIKKEEKDNE